MSQKNTNFHLYAIRKLSPRTLHPHIPLIGSTEDPFILAISPDPFPHSHHLIHLQLIEQEQNKFGQFLFSFRRGESVRISPEDVLIAFPISCYQEDQRYLLLEEQVRKFVVEFKSLMEHEESEDEEYSKYSSSQMQMEGCYGSHSVENRCRGRPRGSRNKRK